MEKLSNLVIFFEPETRFMGKRFILRGLLLLVFNRSP